MPSDQSSGCIVTDDYTTESRYVVVVDECVSPGIAERIAQELKDRFVQVIAVSRSKWKSLKDCTLCKRMKRLCERTGKIILFVTGDGRIWRTGRLKGYQSIRVIPVDQQVRRIDVWGQVGARIVGDVKQRMNALDAAAA